MTKSLEVSLGYHVGHHVAPHLPMPVVVIGGPVPQFPPKAGTTNAMAIAFAELFR